jgi:hypothetical protein
MSIEIKGLQKIIQDLEEVKNLLQKLNGEIISFKPNSSESVEAAILSINTKIDSIVVSYLNNKLIKDFANHMKAESEKIIRANAIDNSE